MKRYLPTILLLACLGGLALVVPVAVRRWSARMAASAASKLDAAKQAAVDGDDDGAIERYWAYLDAAGPNPDPAALEAYALLLLRRAARPKPSDNEVAAAFDAAEMAVRQCPESVELRRRLGELKLATGKPIEAREHLLIVREAIERGTSTDEAAAVELLLAKSWAESGDVDRAAPIFARLIGFNLEEQAFAESGTAQEAGSPPPADAEAFLILANLLRERLRAPAAADVVLERAHELHPDSVKVLLAYSRMKAAAKDVPAARAAAARAAAVDPTDASAILADAQMKASGGNPAAASAAFLTARTQFPDHKGIFRAALSHFQRHGTESETLELLAEGFSKYADEPRFLSFVSAMKLAPESLAPFKQALDDARTQRAADHPALVLLEARLFYEQHQWYRAEPLLSRIRALVPENSKLRIDILLAICHQQLGDDDLRLALLQRYAKPGATPNFIQAGIAAAQLDLGQTDAALASVRMLERQVGDSAAADEDGDADGGVVHRERLRGEDEQTAVVAHPQVRRLQLPARRVHQDDRAPQEPLVVLRDRRKFIRHAPRLAGVMQHHAEAKFLLQPHHRHDVIRAVRVMMHDPLARKALDNRIQPQIAFGRFRLLALRHRIVVLRPLRLILLRLDEPLPHHRRALPTRPTKWRLANAVGPVRHLQPARRPRHGGGGRRRVGIEVHPLNPTRLPQFQINRLPARQVPRPRHHIQRRQPPAPRTVIPRVQRIDRIQNPHIRLNRRAAVRTRSPAHMAVRIHQPRHQHLPRRVNRRDIARQPNRPRIPDAHDLPMLHDQRRVLKRLHARPLRRDQRRIQNRNRLLLPQRPAHQRKRTHTRNTRGNQQTKGRIHPQP